MKNNQVGKSDLSLRSDNDTVLTNQSDSYSIGELAEEFGITTRTLRHYEEKGLITPDRQGQKRIYTRRDRGRLKLVIMGKKVGFSLTDILEMIDLYDLKDGQTKQLEVAASKFAKQIDILEQQKRDVEAALNDLKHTYKLVLNTLEEKDNN